MQEKALIKISDKAITELKTGSNQTAYLYDLLMQHIDTISDLLRGYHFSSRGSVSDTAIDPQSISLNSHGRGSFMVSYILGMFNACADLDLSDKASMKIDLEIDYESGAILLTGEYIPEREPDEF